MPAMFFMEACSGLQSRDIEITPKEEEFLAPLETAWYAFLTVARSVFPTQIRPRMVFHLAIATRYLEFYTYHPPNELIGYSFGA